MYNDRKNYYTFINELAIARSVWKHNMIGSYQTFYGVRYPHIVDVTVNAQQIQEKVFHTIQYISNVHEYDINTGCFVRIEDVTFTELVARNMKQITTKRSLVVKTPNSYLDVTLPISQSIVDRTDNY